MVAVGITQYLTNTVNDPRRSQVGLERVGRFVAPIVLSLICLGCAGSDPARGSQAPSVSPLLELRFGTGWILLGTLDRPTSKWTERPSFRFPDGPEAENPSIPERDEVIQITHSVPVIIVDFRRFGTSEHKRFHSPLVRSLSSNDDTGVVLSAGDEVVVRAVIVELISYELTRDVWVRVESVPR